MSEQQFIDLYIIWRNNFLTIGGFADYFGLFDDDAEYIINRGRQLMIERNG